MAPMSGGYECRIDRPMGGQLAGVNFARLTKARKRAMPPGRARGCLSWLEGGSASDDISINATAVLTTGLQEIP
jgi:hypothetical protein